MALSRVTIVA